MMKFEKIISSIEIIAVVALVSCGVVMGISNNPGGINNNPPDSQNNNAEHTETEIKKEIIAFETKTVDDDAIEYGKTVVRTDGVNGEKTRTYSVTYEGKKEISRKLVKEEITKQPVTKIIAKGTKVVWHCSDATSYDRNPNNDNLCTSSTGERRYVGDCAAVSLDPEYHPGQSGARRYNGCAR